MVKIQASDDDTPVMTNPLLEKKRKKFRLSEFTSSTSLTLSWPFPIIILCFQSNQHILFDPRIYALLFSAYLVSGFFKRLLLQRFLSPSLLNAIAPAIMGFIGNGVFVMTLYKTNWNWVSILFMTLSRLVFGWSTYSALDYSRRAHQVSRQNIPKSIQERVTDLAPDLQDEAFHAGVIVALFLCLILEACLRNVGPQLTEFYSMLIITIFSTALSFISAPCMHSAVRNLINVEVAESEPPVNHPQPSNNSTQVCRQPNAIVLRKRFILSILLRAVTRSEYPSGQLLTTLFSGISTASVICVDYILLPYLLVSTRAKFLNSGTYFPFPEILFIYCCLFIAETGLRYLTLEYFQWTNYLSRQTPSVLLGCLLLVSLSLALTPTILFAAGQVMNSSVSMAGFVLFTFCVIEGMLKAGHTILSGLLFARYHDAIALRLVAQTAEQLVGLTRCFFASLLLIIIGAILYHQLYLTTLMAITVMHYLALSIGIVAWFKVYSKERSQRILIEEVE